MPYILLFFRIDRGRIDGHSIPWVNCLIISVVTFLGLVIFKGRDLRSDAERVTACMSGMPGRSGPNADRLPRAVERIEEAQKRLEQQLESCMETRAEIMCGIMTVRDRPGQEVLRRRYVMGQNFSEIAEAMGVVQRRAYQLHRTAVEGMAVPKRA